MKPHNDGNAGLNTQRLEAFSDGVFAIAITLLILEIKIPHLADLQKAGGLRPYLLSLWPSYVAYALSFFTIGVYWANHHYLFKLIRRTSHGFILVNVVLLMAVSFVPFPTAILGDLFPMIDVRPTAVSFYALTMALTGFCWNLTWLFAVNRRLTDPKLTPQFIRRLTRQYLFGLACYGVALGSSFYSTNLSIGITLGLTALYCLPPQKPQYTDEAGDSV